MLWYFTGGCIDAHSTQPVNIFTIHIKLQVLEQNIGFKNSYEINPASTEELHVQQGKQTPNLQCILYFPLFLSHFTHVQS